MNHVQKPSLPPMAPIVDQSQVSPSDLDDILAYLLDTPTINHHHHNDNNSTTSSTSSVTSRPAEVSDGESSSSWSHQCHQQPPTRPPSDHDLQEEFPGHVSWQSLLHGGETTTPMLLAAMNGGDPWNQPPSPVHDRPPHDMDDSWLFRDFLRLDDDHQGTAITGAPASTATATTTTTTTTNPNPIALTDTDPFLWGGLLFPPSIHDHHRNGASPPHERQQPAPAPSSSSLETQPTRATTSVPPLPTTSDELAIRSTTRSLWPASHRLQHQHQHQHHHHHHPIMLSYPVGGVPCAVPPASRRALSTSPSSKTGTSRSSSTSSTFTSSFSSSFPSSTATTTTAATLSSLTGTGTATTTTTNAFPPKRSRSEGPPCCSNCHSQKSPAWRRSIFDESLLCNACGLYQVGRFDGSHLSIL